MLKEIHKEISNTSDSIRIGELVLDLKTYLDEKQDISRIMDELKTVIG
ncbi:MAG: hypothetical protein IPG53_11195 [Ignavibacteriales bacterium]|nr:hypothetical protein [Ignavibacteriales bacterium]